LLFAGIGYFLIELNNTFAIIRMRASVQTSLYFLLITACPGMHLLYAGIPQRVGRLLNFQSGQENGGQHPTGNTRKDNDGQRKSARRYPSL